ncbi:hypothetical protein AGLY_015943 [Aphis glycines]|uniref:G-protein coupled receptors family 1 profile domain-containing protein n=1 Tax=Aphis glycines TaxID=307491 RepID=A0A6G0T0D5_APHGL|nr:hypothetical protein AGLY_015943 [Aphis glycines]
MMVILWLGVLCLVCAPYFGFGLYWDEKTSTCVRYRTAKKPLDVLYAYLYFGHGVFLCFAIVYTNLAVMKALCMKDSPHNKHNVLMRRISRGSSLTCNTTTKEERSFGWLMFLLCVAFVTCWVPQMGATSYPAHPLATPMIINKKFMRISIPLSRFIDDEIRIRPFTIAADMLLAMHFALDPYLYVLQHWTLVKSICLKSKNKKNANGGSTSVSRSSSMRTTYEVFSQQPL